MPLGLLNALSATTLVLAFAGAAIQAYLASSPFDIQGNALALWALTNVAFFAAVALRGLSGPLARHWGLSLGAFGLGVAALFLMLAAVLQLPFTTTGNLLSTGTPRLWRNRRRNTRRGGDLPGRSRGSDRPYRRRGVHPRRRAPPA